MTRWLAMALAASACAAGVWWGTNAIGGSDSHCYVGQARMFLGGRASLPPPLAFPVSWPSAAATFVPSGFVAKDAAGNGVPLCPAGLPLFMVGAIAVGGPGAWFWVVPVFGGLAVWSTYRLGVHVAGTAVGLAAAGMTLCSPTFLYQLFQPMSDVPAAALWAAALAAASTGLSSGRPAALAPIAAGGLTGLAVLVRPNLAPLAAIPFALTWWTARSRGRAGVAFALALVPGLVTVAWLQHTVYGAAWRSGYGDLGQLFSVVNVPGNLTRYLAWMHDTHTPILLAALAAPLLGPARRVSFALVAFAVGTLAAYLPYVAFESWSYTRFLLPAVPVLAVLLAGVAQAAGRRLPARAAAAATVAVALVVSWVWLDRARSWSVFEVKRIERKYPELGRYAATRLPANAVVLGAQSTGAVRYYAGKPTLSWDAIAPEWLDRVGAELEAHGLEPYLVVESFETDVFRSRFGGATNLGELDWPPRATFGRRSRSTISAIASGTCGASRGTRIGSAGRTDGAARGSRLSASGFGPGAAVTPPSLHAGLKPCATPATLPMSHGPRPYIRNR